ncbi:hypothetical protein AB835_09995 [Candidatus Endobugula sertula]|uniref:Tetratricopeptide repeat protein n=1 Tax=Candidatus Endobugula sertula TaxID=62101 RepID=A0A1D2QNT5_9GAMM|nr:hypothetical protein AB835_09995 [Candidatus Endobugula sertula]
MLSLVSSQNTPIDDNHLVDDYHQWEISNQHGCYFHQHKNFKHAVTHFKISISISKRIKENLPHLSHQKSGLEMLYISSHNLAACYNSEGQCTKATQTLEELHTCLMNISCHPNKIRALRLEALANLDKSLFSLCSQLAYMNRLNEIHEIIMQTECLADHVSNELLEHYK